MPVDECVEPELFFTFWSGISIGEYLEPALFALPDGFGVVLLVCDLRGLPLPFLLVVDPLAFVPCVVFSLGMTLELLKAVTKKHNKSKSLVYDSITGHAFT